VEMGIDDSHGVGFVLEEDNTPEGYAIFSP